MTRVLVVGTSSNSLSRAIASALSDLAVKVVVACEIPTNVFTLGMACRDDHRHTEQYKKALREQAKYNEAGTQQRRKTLTNFHKKKHARMTRKRATTHRSRFV